MYTIHQIMQIISEQVFTPKQFEMALDFGVHKFLALNTLNHFDKQYC